MLKGKDFMQSIKSFFKTPFGGIIIVVVALVLLWFFVVKEKESKTEMIIPEGRVALTEQERAQKIEALKNISTKRINLTEEERQRKTEELKALN